MRQSPRAATLGRAALLIGVISTAPACSSAASAPVGEMPDASPPADAPPPPPTFTASLTSLATDDGRGATLADPMLLDARGLAFEPSGIAWIVASGANAVLRYDASGEPQPSFVDVPPANVGEASRPSGAVINGAPTEFLGDELILAGQGGAIAGWSTGSRTVVRVDASASGAIYTGLARVQRVSSVRPVLGSFVSDTLIATDFHNARVDVFDELYEPMRSSGAFVDPQLPAGYAPFNAAQIGGEVYVTYAKQDAKGKDVVAGPGNGVVSVFDSRGAFSRRFASGGALDAPWAVTIVPSGYGELSGRILVGNYGDGTVAVYDAQGTLDGVLVDASGDRVFVDGLWSLVFYGPVGTTPSLYFTAGPGARAHGAFGRIDLAR